MKTNIGDAPAQAVSVNEAAARIGISRAKFYELLRTQDGPRSFTLGRRRLFPLSEIRRWMAERIDAEHAGRNDANGAAD